MLEVWKMTRDYELSLLSQIEELKKKLKLKTEMTDSFWPATPAPPGSSFKKNPELNIGLKAAESVEIHCTRCGMSLSHSIGCEECRGCGQDLSIYRLDMTKLRERLERKKCCENGNFFDAHECMKQDASSSEFDEALRDFMNRNYSEAEKAGEYETFGTVPGTFTGNYFKDGALWSKRRDAEEIARLKEELCLQDKSVQEIKRIFARSNKDKLTEENQQLQEHNKTLVTENDRLKKEVMGKVYESNRQKERIEKLTAALKFYAEDRLYVNIGCQRDLYDDKGDIAREALASDSGGD